MQSFYHGEIVENIGIMKEMRFSDHRSYARSARTSPMPHIPHATRHTLLMFSRGLLWGIKPYQFFATLRLPSPFRFFMRRSRLLGSRPLLLRSGLLWSSYFSFLLSYLGLWFNCLDSFRSDLLRSHSRLWSGLFTELPLPNLLKLRMRYSFVTPFLAMPTMPPVVISPS